MKRVLLACATALFATPVFAAGWTVDDLGSMAERSACMTRAEATMKKYFAQHGGKESIGKSEWTLGGYGLRGSVVNGLIICPIEAGLVAPFLIVHNTDSDNDARKIVADRLKAIWQAQP
ncbi:hypothetical protein SAMN05421774_102491 [Gemmobacter megaterium]|uniref:Uncharacterized protein n=1 Tax=Gemmobacter megaterium TaxID=1086013 RepID=A0A1N7M894_9RHOB|nr:hypothetical protein [Gemmobacter megaterium]GGE08290.1 hypothetical protein GCM10011345_12470 [Gemmobacter megaterium]SIS82272.1 hypothetical protein SAMN05421774_102491 [Gemmobacter megaterium]